MTLTSDDGRLFIFMQLCGVQSPEYLFSSQKKDVMIATSKVY